MHVYKYMVYIEILQLKAVYHSEKNGSSLQVLFIT